MKIRGLFVASALFLGVAVAGACVVAKARACPTSSPSETYWFITYTCPPTVGAGAIPYVTYGNATGSLGTEPSAFVCTYNCTGWNANGTLSHQIEDETHGLGDVPDGKPCGGTGTGTGTGTGGGNP
jgi:hypothetical protein